MPAQALKEILVQLVLERAVLQKEHHHKLNLEESLWMTQVSVDQVLKCPSKRCEGPFTTIYSKLYEVFY